MRIQCVCWSSGDSWSNYMGERSGNDLRGGLEEELSEVGEEIGAVEQLLALGDDVLGMSEQEDADADGATLFLEVVSFLLGESIIVLNDHFSSDARQGRGDGEARRR